MLEFVVPALNLKAILPQLLLALTALTVLLVDVFAGKEGKTSLGGLSLVGVAGALIALFFIYDWIGTNLLDSGGTIG